MAGLAKLPQGHGVLHPDHDGSRQRIRSFWTRCAKANIKGALVGVEAVTAEGLKSVYKEFNLLRRRAGRQQLQHFREHGVHVLGSFIFGLPTDRRDTFEATADAGRAAAHLRAVRHADAVPRHAWTLSAGRRAGKKRRMWSTAFPSRVTG